MNITSFKATLSGAEISDLKDRLARTRWPDWLPDSDWSYGTEETFLKRICHYWGSEFDFDAHIARLNAWPQFTTEILGERLHFYHVRSNVAGARPLVLIHGWPGSVVEFLELVGPLTDPAAYGGDPHDAFHLVIPSLPGHGFSGPTKQKGVDVRKAAGMIDGVMRAIGYERYFAQGGDWGAITSSRMAELFPERIAALHLNMAPGGPSNPAIPVENLEPEEAAIYERVGQHMVVDGGYSHMHSTRPQTLAVSMHDSPAGLAAWILDKFRSWTDRDISLEDAFGIDHLLDNLSLYWFTRTAGSSFRFYHEELFRNEYRHSIVTVPTGIARFAAEPFTWPRSLVEWNYKNIQAWDEFPVGGHFAAFQRKDDFIKTVRNFFRKQAIG